MESGGPQTQKHQLYAFETNILDQFGEFFPLGNIGAAEGDTKSASEIVESVSHKSRQVHEQANLPRLSQSVSTQVPKPTNCLANAVTY